MVIAAPPPPAVEQPVSHQLSYGVVTGTAAPGTRRVIVRVGRRTLADLPLRQRHFHLHVSLPAAETAIRVVTLDRTGRRSSATVHHVFGAPRAAMARVRTPRNDAWLAREVRRLAERLGGSSAI